MTTDDDGDPASSRDEKDALLQSLGDMRAAVRRTLDGLDDHQARWTPEGTLLPLLGIVNHLTQVEWRWIDGGFGGAVVHRSEREFRPGPERGLDEVLAAYRVRGSTTDAAVRGMPLTREGAGWAEGRDLRAVLLHLITETARHAGHADATRELLDGATGE